MAALKAAEQKCLIRATRVTTMWLNGVPPIAIMDNLCPNDCANQGTCLGGIQICYVDQYKNILHTYPITCVAVSCLMFDVD